MYARLVMFQIGPGMRSTAEALADEAYGMAKGMNGFVSGTYLLFDEANGDYGSMTIWETSEDSDTAGNVFRQWMMGKIGDNLAGAPVIRQAEVYQPR
jgi:heme-degrading monooxygenase HmoA